jgi:hypothetical protein
LPKRNGPSAGVELGPPCRETPPIPLNSVLRFKRPKSASTHAKQPRLAGPGKDEAAGGGLEVRLRRK